MGPKVKEKGAVSVRPGEVHAWGVGLVGHGRAVVSGIERVEARPGWEGC